MLFGCFVKVIILLSLSKHAVAVIILRFLFMFFIVLLLSLNGNKRRHEHCPMKRKQVIQVEVHQDYPKKGFIQCTKAIFFAFGSLIVFLNIVHCFSSAIKAMQLSSCVVPLEQFR